MISKGSLVQHGNGNPEVFVVVSDPYRDRFFERIGLVVDVYLSYRQSGRRIVPCAVKVLKVISQ